MRRMVFITAQIIAGIGVFIACQSPASDKTGGTDSSAGSKAANPEYVFDIQFLPDPPKELQPDATPEQKVAFAWNEFLALNWKSAYYTKGKRDYPDSSWSYENDSNPFPDLAVWETYAHRTELRPYNDDMLRFDAPTHYSFGVRLHPFTFSGAEKFDLFDNLDENNEIGSCNVYAQVDSFQKGYMVLYQAKGKPPAGNDQYSEEYQQGFCLFPRCGHSLQLSPGQRYIMPALRGSTHTRNQ